MDIYLALAKKLVDDFFTPSASSSSSAGGGSGRERAAFITSSVSKLDNLSEGLHKFIQGLLFAHKPSRLDSRATWLDFLPKYLDLLASEL